MFENASMCLRCGNLINILTNCDFVFDDITYKRLIKFFDCTVGKVGAIQKAAKLYSELLCFCLNILGFIILQRSSHHVCLISNGSSHI